MQFVEMLVDSERIITTKLILNLFTSLPPIATRQDVESGAEDVEPGAEDRALRG